MCNDCSLADVCHTTSQYFTMSNGRKMSYGKQFYFCPTHDRNIINKRVIDKDNFECFSIWNASMILICLYFAVNIALYISQSVKDFPIQGHCIVIVKGQTTLSTRPLNSGYKYSIQVSQRLADLI